MSMSLSLYIFIVNHSIIIIDIDSVYKASQNVIIVTVKIAKLLKFFSKKHSQTVKPKIK